MQIALPFNRRPSIEDILEGEGNIAAKEMGKI
jgi:hypothetical protein